MIYHKLSEMIARKNDTNCCFLFCRFLKILSLFQAIFVPKSQFSYSDYVINNDIIILFKFDCKNTTYLNGEFEVFFVNGPALVDICKFERTVYY